MFIIKIILLLALGIVFFQDIKDRLVYWFLFPIIGFCSGFLLYKNLFIEQFYNTITVNMLFVLILFLVVFLYSKIKLRTSITNTFGLGDTLLFFALVFTFSSVSFIILFVFGLVFSLVTHIVLKKHSKHETVPLAGYLSLFFGIAYISHWLGFLKTAYII